MGKSHIGLTYSQEVNELLDKLAQMVNICLSFIQLDQLLCISCNYMYCIFRTAGSCPSGPVEAVTLKSKHLLYMLVLTPQETYFSWR